MSQNGAPTERVQKALSRMGLGSRRQIEQLITEGKVRINGQPAKPGDHVREGDRINIGDTRVVVKSDVNRIRVLLYNKPEGEVCTRKDEQGRRTVFDSIGTLRDGRWIVVGRLDINSSGLLLFTNHGELANHLMHPSSEIEREYAVRVNGEVSKDTIRTLLHGVELEDGFMKFEQIMDGGGQGVNHWYHVVLKEGKNREVRKLWNSQNVSVSRLIRVRYGNLLLPRDLRQGKKRELTLEEIKALFEFVKLEWPASRDEFARQKRLTSGKRVSRKRTSGKGPAGKTSHPVTGQKRKTATRAGKKSAWTKRVAVKKQG